MMEWSCEGLIFSNNWIGEFGVDGWIKESDLRTRLENSISELGSELEFPMAVREYAFLQM